MADAKGAYIGGVPVQFKDAAARAMISDEYNSAETYAKGNLCIYNGKIYEAIKETTGTWDATAWEETTLAKVNGKLNGDITTLKEKAYTPDVIGIQVNADNNSVTFKLKKPSFEMQRYTAILAQTHQDGGLTGFYVISVNTSKDWIEKIAGYDATISRSGDNVTIAFSQIVSVWSSGILIAPKEYI